MNYDELLFVLSDIRNKKTIPTWGQPGIKRLQLCAQNALENISSELLSIKTENERIINQNVEKKRKEWVKVEWESTEGSQALKINYEFLKFYCTWAKAFLWFME